jgi:RNA polymerase sigma factor (sigma-70 family)
MVKRVSCWPRSTGPDILRREEAAGGGHQPRVNAGEHQMTSADTRVSLIVGVCQQDPDRWHEFDAIYRPMLLAYLYKRGVAQSDAGDIVQDIFVKLLTKIHTYDRSRQKFRSWLFSVAQNTLIDRARRRAAYQRALDGWVVHMLRATPSDSHQMAEDWVKIHREKILEHALKTVRAHVTSKSWTCFEQRLLRNRSAIDIGAELKIEPSAVHVNASRVLKQVRAVCNEFDEDIGHAFDSDVAGAC